MKKISINKRAVLVSLIMLMLLCALGFAFSLKTGAANAEAPVYEVTGINGVIAATGTTNDAFYVNASSVSESVTGTWHIQYGGAAKKNGADITVTFRIIKEENRTLYFEGLNASEGDVISVGGIYPITNVIDGCPVTVAVGDYSVKLQEAEFVYNGNNVWGEVKTKVDEAPADNLVLDANGADVAIDDCTVANDNTPDVFGNDGSTKMLYTPNGVESGSTLTVTLGKRYLARNFVSLKMKLVAGSWGDKSNKVTCTAYATSDTEFANPAGSVQTGHGNPQTILEMDAAALADSEGYIDSFVIRKTETFNVGGQMFFDYVELVVADLDDTEYKQNVVLDFTGTDIITSDNIKPKADVNGIFDSANEKVIGTTEMIGNNTVMSFTFAKKYKAANFQSVTIEYAVSDWTMGNKVTITAYALLDFDLVKPLKASTVDGYATRYDSLTMSSEELAGKDGYIRGLVLVKTQTGTEEVPDPKWQFFVNEITLNVPSYTMTIKDGDGTVTKNVVKGESFAVADIGAVNSATHIVAGYKINGKLYSGDYTFVPAENTEIEVVRVAFRVLDGAYIKYIGGTGLRFMLSLNEADYEAVKTLVSEENVSFGVIMIKIDSEGKDSKSMVKEAENYYVEDGTIKFNGVVTGFPETAEAYQTQFRAGGYLGIKYEDKTDPTMIYADEPAAEYKIRSIYEVAKAAIKAGVTGEALVACENIVNTVENANSVLSATNLPDYNVKKKI